jgi:hypothetical protein
MEISFEHLRPEALGTTKFEEALDEAREALRTVTKPAQIKRASGITICTIKIDEEPDPFYGWSVCSIKDQFSKKRGRIISEGRAKKLIKTWEYHNKI